MHSLRRRLEALEQAVAADDCTCCLPVLVAVEPDPVPTPGECPVHRGRCQLVVSIARTSLPLAATTPEWRERRLQSARRAVAADPYWQRRFGTEALERCYGGQVPMGEAA